MSGSNETPRAFACSTPKCPGNAWEVLRTTQIAIEQGGGVKRVRRCLWCKAIVETWEVETFPTSRSLPLSAYFQKRG